MVRGFCSICKSKVGGFLQRGAWTCPKCRKLYCKSCCSEVGLVFKKPVCPECRVELVRGIKAKELPPPQTVIVQQQPAEPKVLLVCPKCKARVPSDSKFCPECGEDLKEQVK